ncbi:MAG: hypothetical protein IJH07_03320 [Ruminococcus sp.]|nr:hypothetical protein [Ruminococcus sp.]
MKIKELTIRKNAAAALDVSWKLSGGGQTSYDLFLIQNGSVIERVRTPSPVTSCRLRTVPEPMTDYALLLTVRSGEQISTARTGYCPTKSIPMYQNIIY